MDALSPAEDTGVSIPGTRRSPSGPRLPPVPAAIGLAVARNLRTEAGALMVVVANSFP